ncbi:Mortality factor 4-like protein [Operophtera brumata]|uniref:Mortality factor 4-like protein 1 n=1 Tax=Operophtera brumata TaxID=104452 RepID=A0A0L7LU06_OPEBR|nr:Mortality factor 4-like protein [Operophtera brumata]
MAPKLKFAEGEKVLCFHGPLIYEAKCLKSSVTKDKHIRYLIHYAGWNKNWDEWVPESRVLKYNEANVQRQKEVQRAHTAQPAKTKKIKIKIPEELKVWLVDDWDVINRQQKLALLPAKLTVAQIVDNYLAFKKSSKTHNATKDKVLVDITEGIKEYFNVTLGSQLLYKFERPQYSEILQEYPDTPMSKMYGSIHLLRLFPKMGPMLAYTALDEKYLQLVLTHIQDFLKYMVTNRSTLFNLQDYGNATPEYHRKVQ